MPNLDDLPQSENVEDRRPEATDADVAMSEASRDAPLGQRIGTPTGGLEDVVYNSRNDLERVTGSGSYLPARRGSLEQQLGRNSLKYAKGGPVGGEKNRLKPMTVHPILPKVRIAYAPVPYLAGSSNDMRTVYIDPAVPRTIQVLDKQIPSAAPLAVHEIYEREAIEEIIRQIQAGTYKVKGGSPDKVHSEIYETAHNDVGLQAEMHFLMERYGFTPKHWQRYQQIMHELAQRTERETLKQAPKDLYTYMYPHLHPHHNDHAMHGGGKIDLGATTLKRNVEESRKPDDDGGISEEEYRWNHPGRDPSGSDPGIERQPDVPDMGDRNTYFPEDIKHNRAIHTEDQS